MTATILILVGALFALGGVIYLFKGQTSEELETEIEEASAEEENDTKVVAPEIRVLKGARKKKLSQGNAPSLRVVKRHEERDEDIPHHLAWYYRVETRPAGPYTLEEMVQLVKKGRVKDDTLVWTEPLMEDWTPARDVDALHAPQPVAS